MTEMLSVMQCETLYLILGIGDTCMKQNVLTYGSKLIK